MDTDVQKESFLDFCKRIAVGPEDDPVAIYSEAVNYTPFYQYVSDHPAEINEILRLKNEEESLARIKELFQNPEVFVTEELPEAPQLKDAKIQEMDVPPVAPVSPTKEEEIRRILADQEAPPSKQTDVSKFARIAAQQFNKTCVERQIYGLPPNAEEVFEKAVEQASFGPNREAVQENVAENVSQRPEFTADRRAIKTVTEGVLRQSPELVDAVWQETATDMVGLAAASDPAVTVTPMPYFTETVAASVVSGNTVDSETIADAARVMKAATVANAPRVNLNELSLNDLSSHISAADAARPEVRDAVFHEVFRQAWEKAGGAEKIVDEMTKIFGQDVVNSPILQKIMESGGVLASQTGAEGIVKNLSAVTNDIVTTFTTTEDTYRIVRVTYEFALAGGPAAIDLNSFIASQLYLNPGSSGITFNVSPLEWILRLGKKEAKAGAAATAGKGVATTAFAKARQSATSGIIKLLTKLGLSEAAATVLGGPLGTVIAIIPWVAGLLWGGLKKIGGFLTMGLTGAANSIASTIIGIPGLRPAPRTGIEKDPILFFALVVTIGAIGLSALVVPLGIGFVIPGSFQTNVVSLTGGEVGAPWETGGGGTVAGPIGSVTSSCANTNGIYLSQANPQWAHISSPSLSAQCTIENSGCGPTSVTMILNAFGSNATVPAVWAKAAAASGTGSPTMGCATGTDPNLNVLTGAGLAVTFLGKDWPGAGAEADRFLKNCGLIFAWGISHHGGENIWHFIVITGINWDTTGKNVVSFITLDPYWKQDTQDGSTFSTLGLWAVSK